MATTGYAVRVVPVERTPLLAECNGDARKFLEKTVFAGDDQPWLFFRLEEVVSVPDPIMTEAGFRARVRVARFMLPDPAPTVPVRVIVTYYGPQQLYLIVGDLGYYHPAPDTLFFVAANLTVSADTAPARVEDACNVPQRRLPIPNYLPQQHTDSQCVELTLAELEEGCLTDLLRLLDESAEVEGEDWWEFTGKKIDVVLEETAALYLILSAALSRGGANYLATRWVALVERCMQQDATWLPRVCAKFPRYTGCFFPDIMKATLKSEILGIASEYRSLYLSKDGEFYGMAPLVLLDGMKAVHDLRFAASDDSDDGHYMDE